MNKLSLEDRAKVLTLLVEGNSLRATARIADVSYNTVCKLFADAGRVAGDYQDKELRDLSCKRLQLDEIWSFVYAKQKNVASAKAAPDRSGDAWTWVAIDPETKAVPVFHVGKREASDADAFMASVAARMTNRIQITSDGLSSYPAAIESAFGNEVNYEQIVKSYASTEVHESGRRYSPPRLESIRREASVCKPYPDLISTSIVERQNLTMRMHMRRLTRLTNAFSKKLENFQAAVALHFGYYNFVKVHSSIRCTPAMAVGASSRLWSVADLVALTK